MACIDDQRDNYGVEPICKVLPIAPSTYYEQKARQADPDRLPPRVRRRQVYRQFGLHPSKDSDKRTVQNFRTQALRELKKIKLAWPELNYSTAPGLLILHPSIPAIAPLNQGQLTSTVSDSRIRCAHRPSFFCHHSSAPVDIGDAAGAVPVPRLPCPLRDPLGELAKFAGPRTPAPPRSTLRGCDTRPRPHLRPDRIRSVQHNTGPSRLVSVFTVVVIFALCRGDRVNGCGHGFRSRQDPERIRRRTGWRTTTCELWALASLSPTHRA